ncbi:MAG: lipopolysaccharide heptosyltransferase II [Planctomycetes bacterium]|nr:lipopolysaccharide heptosyltransferase II [Planctomycetota bacterium]
MNIAIFLPNWVGDVVMATPAIRALRRHYTNARCIAVGRPYVANVLEGSPWFDAHLFLDRWPSAAWRLRRANIDLAVLLPNSFRSGLVAWLAGCKRRIGYRRDWRGWMLTDRLESIRDEAGTFKPSPVIDDYNRLAEAAGCPSPGHRMELFTTPADEAAADAVYAKNRIDHHDEVICLNPGAAFGAAKFWPIESFAAVAQDLTDSRGARVLVLCGPSEREQARAVARLANRPGVVSLADEQLSLGLTKALVRRCTLLVTTDSGPRHFAAAFDRPVVSLFGPTFIDWTRTYFDKEICLQKKVPCGPCQLRVCPLDHVCMKLLEPREVLAAVGQLLRVPFQKAS